MAELSSSGFHGKGIFSSIKSGTKYIEHFLSGFAGYGWKIWEYTTGRFKLEIDDLFVRGGFTVYELIVSKIRAIIGQLGITQACGKIKTVDGDTYPAYYLITVEDTMSFTADDFIRCQKLSATSMKKYWVKVESVDNNGVMWIPKSEFLGDFTTVGGIDSVVESPNAMNIPAIGDDIVQFGNSTNTSRQSAIYMHADENGQPAIDVLFGIKSKSFDGCVKIRLGGDIPGTDGLKGFYCVNGLFKFVDEDGNIMCQINPDGSAIFAQGAVSFSANKSGFIAGGAISWHYDSASNKYVCLLASNVTVSFVNLSSEAQANLKGGYTKQMFAVNDNPDLEPEMGQGQLIDPNDGTSAGWSYTPQTITSGQYLWMIQGEFSGTGVIHKNSNNMYWTTPIRLTGLDGKIGADGTDIEFIYKSSTSATAPTTPTSVNADVNIPTGWTNHPTGVTSTSMYEYVCVRYKKNGTWGVYSTPVLWAKWGEKGQDGDGFEYIYKGTATNTSPSTPVATGTEDDEVPTGWTDNPTGVTSILPYEWVSVRKKTNGTWGAFSVPVVWAKYGADGNKGDPGDDAIVYSITPTSYAVKKSISGIFSPTSVVFAFQKTTGSSTVDYSGYRRIYHSSDGNTFTESVTTASAVTSATVTPNETDKLIKCNLYSDSARTVLLDSQVVIITTDGDNALSGVLTNDSVALPSNSDGLVSDYSNASGNFIVYWGTTDVTNQCTFAVNEGDNVTGAINNDTNKGYYVITEYVGENSASSGALSLIATYNGITISKTFSISKSKAGANGTNGTDANLLDWVDEWNTNATTIDGKKVVSPKGFFGSSNETTGKLTGFGMGTGVIETGKSDIIGVNEGEVMTRLSAETGKLEAKDANISGTVNATNGTFSGLLRNTTHTRLFSVNEAVTSGFYYLTGDDDFNLTVGSSYSDGGSTLCLPTLKAYDGVKCTIVNSGVYDANDDFQGNNIKVMVKNSEVEGQKSFYANSLAAGNQILEIRLLSVSVLHLWAFWRKDLALTDGGELIWIIENPNDFNATLYDATNYYLTSRSGQWT